MGFVMAFKKPVKDFLDPLVTLIYPLPKPALVPLTIVWFGVTHQAAIAVIFLGCLLPIIVNAYNGVLSVDTKLLWSARSLGSSSGNLFRRVIFPASLPYIFNGVQIALPMAFIVLIGVEFIASRAGIGFLISGYAAFGIYDYMFALILFFISFAFFVNQLLVKFKEHALKWL